MIRDEFMKTAGMGKERAVKLKSLQDKYLAQGKSRKEANRLAIAEYNQNKGPKQDGTGPHGQGDGPGKGKADGSGMK